MPFVRLARVDDLPRINEIYNHFVRTSTCTYQEEPDTLDERRAWFARHDVSHPVTVAELDGAVVGWGALSRFHARSAYRFSTENSVYVDPDWHRRGVGRRLLADLIARGRTIGHRTIIAGVDADQTASLALHEALGFVRVGHLKHMGFKFARWLDVIYLQIMLR